MDKLKKNMKNFFDVFISFKINNLNVDKINHQLIILQLKNKINEKFEKNLNFINCGYSYNLIFNGNK